MIFLSLSDIPESRKRIFWKKTRAGHHEGPSDEFLKILNMGPISFKKHEMVILDFSNSDEGT